MFETWRLIWFSFYQTRRVGTVNFSHNDVVIYWNHCHIVCGGYCLESNEPIFKLWSSFLWHTHKLLAVNTSNPHVIVSTIEISHNKSAAFMFNMFSNVPSICHCNVKSNCIAYLYILLLDHLNLKNSLNNWPESRDRNTHITC